LALLNFLGDAAVVIVVVSCVADKAVDEDVLMHIGFFRLLY
jgi:hypothetical protein